LAAGARPGAGRAMRAAGAGGGRHARGGSHARGPQAAGNLQRMTQAAAWAARQLGCCAEAGRAEAGHAGTRGAQREGEGQKARAERYGGQNCGAARQEKRTAWGAARGRGPARRTGAWQGGGGGARRRRGQCGCEILPRGGRRRRRGRTRVGGRGLGRRAALAVGRAPRGCGGEQAPRIAARGQTCARAAWSNARVNTGRGLVKAGRSARAGPRGRDAGRVRAPARLHRGPARTDSWLSHIDTGAGGTDSMGSWGFRSRGSGAESGAVVGGGAVVAKGVGAHGGPRAVRGRCAAPASRPAGQKGPRGGGRGGVGLARQRGRVKGE
jgi:hypothetical protein